MLLAFISQSFMNANKIELLYTSSKNLLKLTISNFFLQKPDGIFSSMRPSAVAAPKAKTAEACRASRT